MRSKNKKYICRECGDKIFLENMTTPTLCMECYNEYMKEYQEARRWLNGGRDNHLVGKHIKHNARSLNGVLKI